MFRADRRFWDGADLALEVVSEDKQERDLVDKRADYAEAHVPEYGSSTRKRKPSRFFACATTLISIRKQACMGVENRPHQLYSLTFRSPSRTSSTRFEPK